MRPWVSPYCCGRGPSANTTANRGPSCATPRERTPCALRKRAAHGAKHPAHKAGLGAVAHLVGPGDPGGADKDFWVRPPPISPERGGEKRPGSRAESPPWMGRKPASQQASQRDREMEEEEEEEQRRAAQWLHGVARPKNPHPPNLAWSAGSLARSRPLTRRSS